jgi:nitrite reductase (NADH) small subunit
MSAAWIAVGKLADIPRLGARVVRTQKGDIAVFRAADDRLFALDDRCPHKGGPLSQGIVHGDRVTCPLHNWMIGLGDGKAVAPDEGCTATYAVRVEEGVVSLCLERIKAIEAA